MKNVLSVMLLSMGLVFSSCTKDRITGSGTITTEDRNITNFTRISMAGSTNVTVIKGQVFNVKVKGYNNLLPYFETNVVNGTLEMGFRAHVNVRNDNTDVVVTLPVLNGLSIAGQGNIVSTGEFTDNNQFNVNIAGSGNITLEHGIGTDFFTSITGSGKVDAFGFITENATIEVSGSGDTRITATNKLQVKITGSGNVYYKGSPLVSVNISGSGKVLKQ